MNELSTCCAHVRISGLSFAKYRTCGATAKVARDGQHYCLRHDPVARKDKKEQAYQEYKAKTDNQFKQRERMAECSRACDGIADPANAIRTARRVLSRSIEHLRHTHPETCTDGAAHCSCDHAQTYREAQKALKMLGRPE